MFLNTLTPKSRQVLAASSAGLLMTAMLATWGYPAAALPQMEKPDSDIHLSPQQASWFATITLLMCVPGPLIGAAAYEWAGPRRVMLASAPILWASTTCMVVVSWEVVQEAGIAEVILLTSRAVQGAVVALLMPIISVYTYEVSDQHLRGTLASLVEFWATLGYLLCYITGCLFSWSTIAWLLPLVTAIPAFIGMLVSPESPMWLARKGKEEEAKAILTQLRCTKEEVLSDLKAVHDNQTDSDLTCSKSLQNAAKKPNLMAMAASSLILIMNQLSGYAVIAIYVVHIFNKSGVGMDPGWSSVVVGFSRLICSSFASFLLHRMSRKLMLTAGNVLTGTASTILGIFFFLQSTGEDVTSIGWLPLFGLVLYMIGYACAVGPTTWTSAVEVLPGPVRSMGLGIGSTNYALAAFLTSKLFPNLQQMIGLHGVFWLFAGGSLGYIILVIFYIPETCGLSMQDIQDYWDHPRKMKKKAVHV